MQFKDPDKAEEVIQRLRAFWAARCNPGTFGYILAMLWPFGLFATVLLLTVVLVKGGAAWALPAFVLPVTILLLAAGPKFPPPDEK
jgi:fatty acid desaturase